MEKCIRGKFVPAIIDRNVSDLHRRMLELSVRWGERGRARLGIVNPVEITEKEYQTSLKIIEELVDLINQESNNFK